VDTKNVKAIGSTISALRHRKYTFREDLKKAGESQIERLARAEREKLALQKLIDLKATRGDSSTPILNREDMFGMMYGDAYH
jgi:hypothetical protein